MPVLLLVTMVVSVLSSTNRRMVLLLLIFHGCTLLRAGISGTSIGHGILSTVLPIGGTIPAPLPAAVTSSIVAILSSSGMVLHTVRNKSDVEINEDAN